jgi:ATP-dependent protease Clp ATPase subunit
MFDLPSMKNARRVVLDRGAIMGKNQPYVVYETEEPLALKPPEEYERPTGSDG